MFFRRNWVKTTGHILDSRIRKIYHNHGSGRATGAAITLHSYVVEFAAPDGTTTRLEVEQRLEVIDLTIGGEAPLLVSPDGKKAVFDHKDPRINMMAVHRAMKQADEDRFRQQLEG
jgi:hypothetical protein